MTTNAAAALAAELIESEAELSIAAQIEQFLNGENDGGALFETLYGRAEDEPVPERLLAIVRSAR
jgi:hypothetical protein